jgi:hypothetical protein
MSQPKHKPEEEELLAKLRTLPPARLAEALDFIDFLRQRSEDEQLTAAASHLSEVAFARVWENPDDAGYDRL